MSGSERPWDWLPIGLYRTTPDGRFLDGNPAFARLLGVVDLSELVGRDVAAFYLDPAERLRWRERLDREGVVRDWEFTVRRQDGSLATVRDTATAVRSATGEVLHYEGAVEDVSARRESEEALRRSEAEVNQLAHALRSISEGVCVSDLEERIFFVNDAWLRIYGYSREEMLG